MYLTSGTFLVSVLTHSSTFQGLNFFLSGLCKHSSKIIGKLVQSTFCSRTGVVISCQEVDFVQSVDTKSVSVATRKSPKSWFGMVLFGKCIKRSVKDHLAVYRKVQFLTANNTQRKEIKTSFTSLDWSRSEEKSTKKSRVGTWGRKALNSDKKSRNPIVPSGKNKRLKVLQTRPNSCSCSFHDQQTTRKGRIETSPKGRIKTSPKGRIKTSPKGRIKTSPKGRIKTSPNPRLIVRKKIQSIKRKSGGWQIRIQEESYCLHFSKTLPSWNKGK